MPVRPPGVDRRGTKFLLDLEQPVVLGGALAAHRGAGLDLPGVQRHDEIGDQRVLGLAGPLGDDDAPSPAGGLAGRGQRFGQRPGLIDLEQQGIGRAEQLGPLDALPVGRPA
jgi:hypothetical protein